MQGKTLKDQPSLNFIDELNSAEKIYNNQAYPYNTPIKMEDYLECKFTQT